MSDLSSAKNINMYQQQQPHQQLQQQNQQHQYPLPPYSQKQQEQPQHNQQYQHQQQPYSQQQQQQQQPQIQQNSTTVVTSAAMQPTIVIGSVPHTRLNVNRIKGLSITQLVIGVVTLGLGIGFILSIEGYYWVSYSSGGVWGGVCIIVTGIFGICASFNPNNRCLIGTTLAFNIIATILSFIDGIILMVGLAYTTACDYSTFYYYDSFDGLYFRYYSTCSYFAQNANIIQGILLAASIIEFILALITSIYCCNGCCGGTSTGMVVQQNQPQYISTSTASGYMPSQPVHNPAGVQYNANYPPQYQPHQPYMSQATGGSTNVAYSMKSTEKRNLVENEEPMDGYQEAAVNDMSPPYSLN